jgi:hypothetical protein
MCCGLVKANIADMYSSSVSTNILSNMPALREPFTQLRLGDDFGRKTFDANRCRGGPVPENEIRLQLISRMHLIESAIDTRVLLKRSLVYRHISKWLFEAYPLPIG